jgi:hypothetical protein
LERQDAAVGFVERAAADGPKFIPPTNRGAAYEIDGTL